jgi:hypothetical protein
VSQDPGEFVIRNCHGDPMITVRRDSSGVTLSVRARRNGDEVTIAPDEAAALAAALTGEATR